jgi:RimJ/RimL family protein N-acetyltransferase
MIDLKIFAGSSFFYPIKDSTYLCFKALEHADREKFLDGFKKLSRRTVYHRFFGFMKELTNQQVEDLLNTDKRDHVAWTAFDIADDDVIGIGVGRFRRSTTQPNEAELALTVIDEYQEKGVGTVLLAIMYYLAARLEIDIFTAVILSDNAKLIKRFKELGAKMTRAGSEYEMRLPVLKDFDDLPKTKYSRIIKPVLRFLKENDFCG